MGDGVGLGWAGKLRSAGGVVMAMVIRTRNSEATHKRLAA